MGHNLFTDAFIDFWPYSDLPSTQQSSTIKVRAYYSIRATYKITFRIQKSNIGTVNCISFHYRIKRTISRFEFQVAHATFKVNMDQNLYSYFQMR